MARCDSNGPGRRFCCTRRSIPSRNPPFGQVELLPDGDAAIRPTILGDVTPYSGILLGRGYYHGPTGGFAIHRFFLWSQGQGLQILEEPSSGGTFEASDLSDDASIIAGRLNSEPAVRLADRSRQLASEIIARDESVDLAGWTPTGFASVFDDGKVLAFTAKSPSNAERCYALELSAPLQ